MKNPGLILNQVGLSDNIHKSELFWAEWICDQLTMKGLVG